MGLVLLIVLLVVLLGGLPQCGYHDLGYGPSSAAGLVLLVVLILLLAGRL